MNHVMNFTAKEFVETLQGALVPREQAMSLVAKVADMVRAGTGDHAAEEWSSILSIYGRGDGKIDAPGLDRAPGSNGSLHDVEVAREMVKELVVILLHRDAGKSPKETQEAVVRELMAAFRE